MAKSTIDAIRKVEQETLEAEKKAAADARALESRTKDDVEALIRDTLNKAQEEAARILKDAEVKQKELIDQKSLLTVQAVEKLKASAREKQEKAVEAILKIASGQE